MDFRESDVKKDEGNIKKEYFMKKMFETFGHSLRDKNRSKIFDLIFERFRYGKNTIDIYDFLVSMSICSRMSYDDKLQRTVS